MSVCPELMAGPLWEAKLIGLAFDFSRGEGVPTNEPWTEPRFWNDGKWNGAEQPVVGVTRYEAVAFCRWLSDATGEKSMPERCGDRSFRVSRA